MKVGLYILLFFLALGLVACGAGDKPFIAAGDGQEEQSAAETIADAVDEVTQAVEENRPAIERLKDALKSLWEAIANFLTLPGYNSDEIEERRQQLVTPVAPTQTPEAP